MILVSKYLSTLGYSYRTVVSLASWTGRLFASFSELQREVLSQILDFYYVLYMLTSPSAQNMEKSVFLGRENISHFSL